MEVRRWRKASFFRLESQCKKSQLWLIDEHAVFASDDVYDKKWISMKHTSDDNLQEKLENAYFH